MRRKIQFITMALIGLVAMGAQAQYYTNAIVSDNFDGGTIGDPIPGYTATTGSAANFKYYNTQLTAPAPTTSGRIDTDTTIMYSNTVGTIAVDETLRLQSRIRASGSRDIRIYLGADANIVHGGGTFSQETPMAGFFIDQDSLSFMRPDAANTGQEMVFILDPLNFGYYEVRADIDTTAGTVNAYYRPGNTGAGSWTQVLTNETLNWTEVGYADINSVWIHGEVIGTGDSGQIVDYTVTCGNIDTSVPPPAVQVVDEDFEGMTVGENPVVTAPETGSVLPVTATADNFVTVVNSTFAGTGNGIRFSDRDASTHTSLAYDFSEGTGAVQVDWDMAVTNLSATTGSPFSRKIRVALMQYGNDGFIVDNMYTVVRLYSWGSISGVQSNNASEATIHDSMAGGASAHVTLYANDTDSILEGYLPDGKALSNDMVVAYLNGVLWYEEHLNEDLLSTTTNGFGRLAFASDQNNGDELDYMFDNIAVIDLLPPAFPTYAEWLALYPTLPLTGYGDDSDDDGMDNLLEYGLGGIPTNDDAAAILPKSSLGVDGGTNWLNYIYARRDNAAALGLTYSVVSDTDLVLGTMTTPTEEAGSGAGETGFDVVTNRISSDAATQAFMKLKIEID